MRLLLYLVAGSLGVPSFANDQAGVLACLRTLSRAYQTSRNPFATSQERARVQSSSITRNEDGNLTIRVREQIGDDVYEGVSVYRRKLPTSEAEKKLNLGYDVATTVSRNGNEIYRETSHSKGPPVTNELMRARDRAVQFMLTKFRDTMNPHDLGMGIDQIGVDQHGVEEIQASGEGRTAIIRFTPAGGGRFNAVAEIGS